MRILYLVMMLMLTASRLVSQQTAVYSEPQADYRMAMDLFAKQKYGAAQHYFSGLLARQAETDPAIIREAMFHDAVCSYELFNPDAEYKLQQYKASYPTSAHLDRVQFYLGNCAYRSNKYKAALAYYEDTDPFDLSVEQGNEFMFRKGYCYLRTDQPDKAEPIFRTLKDKDSKYSSPARYYHAHLQYTRKDYESALEGFLKLEKDENFKDVAPYYIIQIYGYQEKYDLLLEKALPLYEVAPRKRAPEVARLIGEAYYRKSEFGEALPYYEKYFELASGPVSEEDRFKLGYCHYREGNYQQALMLLQASTAGGDSLSQYAYYYLADCYLKTSQRQFARSAFQSAWKLAADRDIREDALFNYAKLTYEMSYDPYSEATQALKSYLKDFPDSKRSDEAYTFLVNIALATRNYSDALSAIEKIKKHDDEYYSRLQKISFYRGVELFNQGNFEEANTHFRKAMENGRDKKMAAESLFWMGESLYRQKSYWGAKKYLGDFQKAGLANQTDVFNKANYTLGYAHFKEKQYAEAGLAFRKFVTGSAKEDKNLVSDAYYRLGDCFFIQKKYDDAIAWYDEGIKMNRPGSDYALFQKGLALGALQKNDDKLLMLMQLTEDHPASAYVDDACYELGNTFLLVNNNEKALLYFKKITEHMPSSSYKVKALLKTGLLYYNLGQNDIALVTFKKIVEEYPATPESKEALASIRNIYVDLNRVDEFFVYVKGISFANVTAAEQDSITYVAAENQYMAGNCEDAVKSFASYVENFPGGAYFVHANYYRGECLLKANLLQEALECFENVLGRFRSKFTENALLKAARIYYFRGDYIKSLEDYSELKNIAEYNSNVLEARYHIMKCNYLLGNYKAAAEAAGEFLAGEKADDQKKTEAVLTRAKSNISLGDHASAQPDLETVVRMSKGKEGAEAKYLLANLEYIQAQYKEAEKLIFELINQYANQDYWVASGFILLSDVYVKNGNIFQARQTLQSILENYEGDDLKQVAREKLTALDKAEQPSHGEIRKDTLSPEEEEIILKNN